MADPQAEGVRATKWDRLVLSGAAIAFYDSFARALDHQLPILYSGVWIS
jgi:hypothetical protein